MTHAASPAISRHPIANLNDVPEDLREAILAIQEKMGFIPNVFAALSHRPEEFRAFFIYHNALMEKDVGLTKAEREMIVVAISGVNRCQYCVVSHGAILRIRTKDPLIADQIAINPRKADISPRQLAMLDFALKVCTESHNVTEEDYQRLHAHGFDDDAIWDIVSITAFFSMSNRLANAASIKPNAEFYLMGRVPHKKG